MPVAKPPPAWAENSTAPTEKAAINGVFGILGVLAFIVLFLLQK